MSNLRKSVQHRIPVTSLTFHVSPLTLQLPSAPPTPLPTQYAARNTSFFRSQRRPTDEAFSPTLFRNGNCLPDCGRCNRFPARSIDPSRRSHRRCRYAGPHRAYGQSDRRRHCAGDCADAGVSGPLSAAQAEIVYNPAVLEFRSVAPAGFLSSTGRQVICPPPSQSNGRAKFACASAGPNNGPTGSGPLVTLTFGAIGPGQSNLNLEGISLVNSSRPPAAISSSTQGAQLTVDGETPVETDVSIWLPLINR